MKQYLAIDIGGTSVKLGLVDETGGILAKAEESVSFDGWQTPILTTVLAAAERFLTARGEDPQALEGIGVSATGQINSHTGVVVGTCGNLPNYIGSSIKEQLEAKFHRPVTVANDANCMCLGEVWVGGAKGYTDVIGVTLGTGVGGGILTGGRLLEGARGLGGEMGHYRTHAQHGLLCTCGAVGCWEQYASTTALVRGAHAIDPNLERWPGHLCGGRGRKSAGARSHRPLDGRDRAGAGGHGAHLQSAAHPGSAAASARRKNSSSSRWPQRSGAPSCPPLPRGWRSGRLSSTTTPEW